MKTRIRHKYLINFDEKPFKFDSDFDKKVFISDCNKRKGKAYLVIQDIKKTKTNEQNRYYRGVVVQRLAEYWGLSNQEAHEAISLEHLSYRDAKGLVRVRSTQLEDWSTVEWEDYMSFLRKWAWDKFKVWIEPPNMVDYDSLPEFYY